MSFRVIRDHDVQVRVHRRRDARGSHLATDDDLGQSGHRGALDQGKVFGERRLDVRVDQQHAQAHVGQQRAQVGSERRLADATLGTCDGELDHRFLDLLRPSIPVT